MRGIQKPQPTNLQPTVTSLKQTSVGLLDGHLGYRRFFLFCTPNSSSSSCSVKADNLMTCSSSSMINAGSKPRCFQHKKYVNCTFCHNVTVVGRVILWHVFFRHVFCVDSSTIMYHGIFSHCWWHLSWAPMERKRSQHAHAWRTRMFSKGELPGNQDIQKDFWWCSKLLDIPIYKFLIRWIVIFLAPTKPHHLIGLPLCRDTTTNSPCLNATHLQLL